MDATAVDWALNQDSVVTDNYVNHNKLVDNVRLYMIANNISKDPMSFDDLACYVPDTYII